MQPASNTLQDVIPAASSIVNAGDTLINGVLGKFYNGNPQAGGGEAD